MSIISGQDSRFQIGLANTWRVPTRTKFRLPYTQEGFKASPNYKEAEALVGASGTTSMAIMSFKADGSFTTYLPPDLAKILFFAALGYEYAPTGPDANGQRAHKFVPISAGACQNLPSLTCEVDRLQEKALYLNYKMTDWKLSGKAEDYLMFETSGPAFKEDIQTVLNKFAVATPTVATVNVTVVPPVGAITAADVMANAFVGKVVRVVMPDCSKYYFTVVSHTISLLTMLPIAAWGFVDTPANYVTAITGGSIEILDWEMAPNTPASDLEYLRFVHGTLTMDDVDASYKVLGTGMGKLTDTIVDVPLTATGAAGFPLIVSALDKNGARRSYKYISATPVVRTTLTILTFSALTTDGMIPAIHDANGVLDATKWAISEEAYDEITEFTLSGDNKIGEAVFGMNGSMFGAEVNPTSRSFSLDISSRFTTRMSKLRLERMMTGHPCKITLEFQTKILDGPFGVQLTSVDSGGKPYRVVIEMKKAYMTEGGANISGPDEPTISPKFTLAETPTGANAHKAVEITVYDDVTVKTSTAAWSGTKTADGAVPMVREDAYIG